MGQDTTLFKATAGIDIAKKVNQVYMVTADGVITNKAVKRNEFLDQFTNVGPYLIAMEACSGSQYLARELTNRGHTVVLLNPKAVKPYVEGLKNDKNDAEGIYKALINGVGHVTVKSAFHRDLDLMLTIRSKIQKDRTALINHIRGILAEYGIVMNKSFAAFQAGITEALSKLAALQDVSLCIVEELRQSREEVSSLSQRLVKIDKEIEDLARQDKHYEIFLSAPGIGKVAAAKFCVLLAAPENFRNGRQFAAFLGLAPMSRGSGGKNIVTGIPRHRCDLKTRALIVQCAHATARSKTRTISTERILSRKPKKVAIIAIANRLVRSLWAMAMKGEDWKPVEKAPA